jgi:hypothetical protein
MERGELERRGRMVRGERWMEEERGGNKRREVDETAAGRGKREDIKRKRWRVTMLSDVIIFFDSKKEELLNSAANTSESGCTGTACIAHRRRISLKPTFATGGAIPTPFLTVYAPLLVASYVTLSPLTLPLRK